MRKQKMLAPYLETSWQLLTQLLKLMVLYSIKMVSIVLVRRVLMVELVLIPYHKVKMMGKRRVRDLRSSLRTFHWILIVLMLNIMINIIRWIRLINKIMRLKKLRKLLLMKMEILLISKMLALWIWARWDWFWAQNKRLENIQLELWVHQGKEEMGMWKGILKWGKKKISYWEDFLFERIFYLIFDNF